MIVQRTETHVIKESNPIYNWILEECSRSKNLYNKALYVYRQAFTGKHDNIPEFKDIIKHDKFIASFALVNRLNEIKDVDFCSMMKKNGAQQIVFQVDKSMKSWFASLKAYKKDSSKFRGRPRIPSYKKKGELNCLTYTTADAKLQKDGTINISKKIKLSIHTKLKNFQQIRLVPKTGYVQVEIVYNKEVNDNRLDQTRAIGIDLGLNNLMAITSNIGNISNLVNGRPLKSINQYYNKRKAHFMSLLERGKLKSSKRLRRLEMKRIMKIKDYLHKTSRRVVELMEQNNIGTCFIGHNDGWKNEANMGKKNNQNFVSIPYSLLINMLKYKIEEKGGQLVELNESYTSKCSFLDNEEVCKHETYKGKRVKRGLFLSENKKALNADINGSLNILKRGIGFSFKVENDIFRPTKIDIEKKLLNPLG
ncbi:MAG: transposase [Paludibacteraceae bacterium]|nr:transposase [Paludibacteraceae bacterium]